MALPAITPGIKTAIETEALSLESFLFVSLVLPQDENKTAVEMMSSAAAQAVENLLILFCMMISFHPDYTVGTGVSPVQSELAGSKSRAIPPVGNGKLKFPHPTLKIFI
jgi:hypothetical protein